MLTNKTFTGKRSEDIALLDFNALLDPALGRFISADTIVPGPGSPLAWDRYAYVFNNPVNLVDPDGHRPCDEAYCPGEVYDPIAIHQGESWYGEWDTDAQQKRSEAIEDLVIGGGEIFISILWEPARLIGLSCLRMVFNGMMALAFSHVFLEH